MLTDGEIDNLWIMRREIHNGDLMLQLRDFARAIEQATRRASDREAIIEECCAAIKAEDDRASAKDYMLDSDDCIAVLRELKSADPTTALDRLAENARELGLDYDAPTDGGSHDR